MRCQAAPQQKASFLHSVCTDIVTRKTEQGCSERHIDIGVWCNGNTTDSGPVILGSSPSTPTEKIAKLFDIKHLAVFLFQLT